MNTKELIEKWASGRKSFYFFLPDGPYGRPFDNQYLIDKVEEVNGDIIIKFKEGLALRFTGMVNVVDDGCNLLINNYNSCDLVINGSLGKSFDYGEVALSGF
ncbi:hypothetical protein QMX33_002892 [Yersinia ruckeri]|nr:hypothetical protein [Yersinia ruckeri]EKN4202976.1 hypothetical protein [Yersinia ruckeri]EKN4207891.1 hypothetical protein [Yersinia ruckeri]EKN4727396.1 hypothetical protein [Yersinia ruckeri]ELV7521698.1 hypothetical protein [Yersinia ruckeri]